MTIPTRPRMSAALAMVTACTAFSGVHAASIDKQKAQKHDNAPALFSEIRGEREFSGQMVVKFKTGNARAGGAARDRLAPWLVRNVTEVDEAIIRIPAGETENSIAATLLATGDYEYVQPDWRVYAVVIPNDPSYGLQWHLPQIGAPSAWDITTGNPTVIVAVCDSGISASHPDLAPVLLPGYNAVDRLEQASGGQTDGLTHHGTHVAGVIAAAGNNAIGITGVGWNLRLFPVRVSNQPNDTALLSDINAGARWAVDHGARVVNASFSGVHDASVSTTGAYVREHGGLYVWAAGNASGIAAGVDLPSLVVVSGTNQQNALASFSNFGPAIDVAAPGVGIYSTRLGGQYAAADGTSFAAPIVAGVLALQWSMSPTLTPLQAETILTGSATDLGSAGRDDLFGAGLVNAAASVTLARDALKQPLAPRAHDDAFWLVGAAPMTLDVLANDVDLNPDEPLTIASFDDAAPSGATVALTSGPQGRDALLYAPPPEFRGFDTIEYAAEDPTGGSGTAVARVGVTRAATFAAAVPVIDQNGNASQLGAPRVADLDADGDMDIAVAHGSTIRTLIMARNDGNGEFSFAGAASLGVGGDTMALGRFNADQWTDVAVVSSVGGALGVAYGTGPFAFGPVTTYAETSPAGVIAADAAGLPLDLNHDGHTDIVHLRDPILSRTLVVRLNDGAGGFATTQKYQVNIQPSLVRAVDLNNDGYADLITGNLGTSTLSVLMNDGTGHFGAVVNVPVGLSPADVAAADIDGDADLDVLVLGSGFLGELPGVRILRNNGQGTLTMHAQVGSSGWVPSSLVAADFNLDSLPDIVTSNLLSREVFLNLNYAEFRFGPAPVTLATDLHNLHRIAAADLNADGKADLITANSFIGAIVRPGLRIMLNTTPPIPPAPCSADFDEDGTVNSQDFFDFLAAFFGAQARADINEDGVVNSQDFFDFLAVFFTGC